MSVLFVACGNGKKKSMFTPTSSGRAYEVLVVIDLDMWERPAGRALFDVLDSDVPGLPQSERSFRIMYTDPSNYDATLKIIRNIIVVEVNKDLYTQPKLKSAQNVYAAPQSILTIQAPDEKTFGAIFPWFCASTLLKRLYRSTERDLMYLARSSNAGGTSSRGASGSTCGRPTDSQSDTLLHPTCFEKLQHTMVSSRLEYKLLFQLSLLHINIE